MFLVAVFHVLSAENGSTDFRPQNKLQIDKSLWIWKRKRNVKRPSQKESFKCAFFTLLKTKTQVTGNSRKDSQNKTEPGYERNMA